MRDRLISLRKALDKETKEREAVANKAVRDVYLLLPRRLSIPLLRLLKPLEHFSTRTHKLKPTLRLSMLRAMQRYLAPYLPVLNIPKTFDSQILQAVVLQAKKLGKAAYVFSVDSEGGRVIHVNHVPESLRSKGFDARTWAARVTETLGGKVNTLP